MNTAAYKPYSKGEEIMNSISHGIGSLLSVIGGSVMVTLSACFSNWRAVMSSSIYSFALVLMFTMSTLYHAIPFEKAKKVMRIMDHNCIYLLIAGTYTPITIVLLMESGKGIFIFTSVWILAVLGIILNAISLNKFKHVSLVLYLLMGWAVVFDFKTVATLLGKTGLILLAAGGISYTVGVVFYKLKKIRYMHGVWHLFVLCGAVLHYFCVLSFILPAA